MRKQKEVKVIYTENYNIDEKINKLIKEGYELLGAVSVVLLPYGLETKCYATMVKYETDPKIIEAFTQYKCLNCSLDSSRCRGLKCDEAVAKTLKKAGIEWETQ